MNPRVAEARRYAGVGVLVLAPIVVLALVAVATEYPLYATREVTRTVKYGLVLEAGPIVMAWYILLCVALLTTIGPRRF